MNRFNFFIAFAIALTACTYAVPSGYSASLPNSNNYNLDDAHAAADGSNAAATAGNVDGTPSYAAAGQSHGGNSYGNAYGKSYGQQPIPHSPANTRGNTVTSSITYPHNKGEILIHRPAAIIVKRPPTKVLVNHPPLVVKPAPVVLHKPPAVVLRKVLVKHHPRPVQVEPVYVNVVKPPAEKYFVNEKTQYSSSPAHYSAASRPAYAASHDNAAANAGYQLLSSGHGLTALNSLQASSPGGSYNALPAPYSPGAAAGY